MPDNSKFLGRVLSRFGYVKSVSPIPEPWYIKKQSRAWPTDGIYTNTRHVMGVIKPIYNPIVLVNAVETVSVLQTVISKITNEVVKNGWDFEEKFVLRCLECDAEYQTDVKGCKCGSKLLHKPDESQLKNLKKLLNHPNNGPGDYVVKTFIDIIKDCVYYNKSIDDFYLELVLAPDGTPVEIWSLPACDIRIFGDVTVKRFKDSAVQKFCKSCYSNKKYFLTDKFYDADRLNCPDCKRPLSITAFVQLSPAGDNIIARWSDDEIIHGNSRGFGSTNYGNPPLLSVLNAAMILNWMEIYQRDAYSQNKAPDGILNFPGMDTDELLDMQDKLEHHKRLNPASKKMIWLPTSEAATYIQTMPKLVDMDAVEMAKFYREQIAICYGVSLNMLGVQTPGKLGNETETVEVSYGTIEETQTQLSEVINTRLLPLFPEIRDWRFKFNPPKKDDEMRKAELVASYASTIATLRGTGIDAIFDADFKVCIRGEQPSPKEPQAAPIPFGIPSGYNPSPFQSAIQPEEVTPIEKALSPRGIDPIDAVSSIRQLEDSFLAEITQDYESGISKILKTAKINGVTRLQLQGDIEEYTKKFIEKALKQAETFATEAYRLGMETELATMGMDRSSRFTQIDENAIRVMQESPESVFGTIKTFGDETVKQFREIIGDAYSKPLEFDLNKMVKQMEAASDGDRYKLERIARSETTRISNMGRANQWKQYADPSKKEYFWVDSTHTRIPTCPICKAIAKGGQALVGKKAYGPYPGNPYQLSDLQNITNDWLAHPNCRCTVVRRPLGNVGGETQ